MTISEFVLFCIVYLSISGILAWVVEPYLRLRRGFVLANSDDDREILKILIPLFWPIAGPVYIVIKFVLSSIEIITKITEKSEQFWTPKPKPEKIVDEAKSSYRNVSFTNEEEK